VAEGLANDVHALSVSVEADSRGHRNPTQ
jgi:hypothetical protein